jgi:hypothetical protein
MTPLPSKARCTTHPIFLLCGRHIPTVDDKPTSRPLHLTGACCTFSLKRKYQRELVQSQRTALIEQAQVRCDSDCEMISQTSPSLHVVGIAKLSLMSPPHTAGDCTGSDQLRFGKTSESFSTDEPNPPIKVYDTLTSKLHGQSLRIDWWLLAPNVSENYATPNSSLSTY